MSKYNQEGPCLPWCFSYYENQFVILGLVIGIIIGIIICIFYAIYLRKKKNIKVI